MPVPGPRLPLVLTACSEADADALEAIAADPRVAQQLWVGRPGRLWAAGPRPGQAPDTLRLCLRAADGAVLGLVQCIGGQLSYFLHPDAWGQGLGAEMVAAACTLPALRLTRIRAEVIRENLASRRILEHTGFRFAAIYQRAWSGRPGRVAMLVYERPPQT
jgi:RimJ/RimL family protein N-acetyltransferase